MTQLRALLELSVCTLRSLQARSMADDFREARCIFMRLFAATHCIPGGSLRELQ